jgi:hypothetical protein
MPGFEHVASAGRHRDASPIGPSLIAGSASSDQPKNLENRHE